MNSLFYPWASLAATMRKDDLTMKNQKMIPFERNKYFYGKLLTVRDFEIEQRYFNDKRRLVNRLLMGPGILAGLGTLLLDDKTLMIQPGIAIDFLGREIVVESPYTSRLSVIEGFEDLDEYGDAYLSIFYDEDEKETVHNVAAPNGGEGQSAYNRISEGFHIKLSKTAPNRGHLLKDLLWIRSYNLYEDAGISVTLRMEHMASARDGFYAQLEVIKLAEGPALMLDLKLSSSFVNFGQELVFKFDESKSDGNGHYVLDFHFEVSPVLPQDDLLEVKSFVLKYGDRTLSTATKPIKHKVVISEKRKQRMIEDNYRQIPLDELLEEAARDEVCLAKLRYLKTEKTYIVENVLSDPFEQLIHSYPLARVLRDTEGSYEVKERSGLGRGSKMKQLDLDQAQTENQTKTVEKVHASGKILFDFKSKVNPKDKFFSAEVSHDLGQGDVFIDLAVDSQTRDGESDYGYQNQMVFGDYEIFEKSKSEPSVPIVKTAAIMYKNKGTFVVGIQFVESYSKDDLSIAWKATRVNRKYDQLVQNSSALVIEPSMIKVKTKTKISFNVFSAGEPLRCEWAVKDENGGEIDQNGVYMSPSTEGVYEVVAKNTDLHEEISAFVIVENQ